MIFDYSSNNFVQNYTYTKHDLGVTLRKTKTVFKLWSPYAETVQVLLYKNYLDEYPSMILNCDLDEKGVFVGVFEKNLEGYYYLYNISFGSDKTTFVDPYAKAVSVNGLRGYIINLASTNPEDFDKDSFVSCGSSVDAVVYELHVRDFSIDKNSGVKMKGKFLGFCEDGAKLETGEYTTLAHLKELGVTHVHLLPISDYATVDETSSDEDNYNWGYDQLNYNVPEGSYSTDPCDPAKRIYELKMLVKTLHQNNIGVIMDVVYNHSYYTEESNFHKAVPFYYHRLDEKEMEFSNGSGCGNEIASEKPMVSKFIIDSLVYWTKEYHIDGFRFDLMGLLDVNTLNKGYNEVKKINPSLLFYGEPWCGGQSALPYEISAVKQNLAKLDSNIGVFNDNSRDAIKGGCFDVNALGYVNGSTELCETIKASVVAFTPHPDVHYDLVKGTSYAFAKEPTQVVSYNSCHDNYTLFDKLLLSRTDLFRRDVIKMNKLAAALVLTAQGMPFIHAGEEMLRSKPKRNGLLEHNSYNAPDFVNSIKWEKKHENIDVFNYYKGLIEIRKNHQGFRMRDANQIKQHIGFIYTEPSNRVGFIIKNHANGDVSENIVVVYNPCLEGFELELPFDNFVVLADDQKASNTPIAKVEGRKVFVKPLSAMILVN